MTTTTPDGPCWVLKYPDDGRTVTGAEDYVPHFATAQAARAGIADWTRDDPPWWRTPEPHPLPELCHRLQCTACGREPDDGRHLESREAAPEYARSIGWTVVDDNATCPGCPWTRTTRFMVSCLPEDHLSASAYTITVQYRPRVGLWAVCRLKECLGADGTWSYESSDRSDEWEATHYFDLETALRLAREAAPKITSNGYTVADMLAPPFMAKR